MCEARHAGKVRQDREDGSGRTSKATDPTGSAARLVERTTRGAGATKALEEDAVARRAVATMRMLMVVVGFGSRVLGVCEESGGRT